MLLPVPPLIEAVTKYKSCVKSDFTIGLLSFQWCGLNTGSEK
jgi:hypothetical protein